MFCIAESFEPQAVERVVGFVFQKSRVRAGIMKASLFQEDACLLFVLRFFWKVVAMRKYQDIGPDGYAKLVEQLRRRPRAADDIKIDVEDDAKSGGSNLAIGSPEYMEMLRDRRGMDEHEQRAAKLAGKVGREADEPSATMEEQLERRERDAKTQEIRVEEREEDEDGRLTTAEREVSHQVRKMDALGGTLSAAAGLAASTETLQDDEYVRSKLPGLLAEQVYDNEVDDDFDFPGASVFKRYC